ncbi:PREDICTED: secretoglobin family 1D member 4-like, partial [Propithecus coquereli]|uniref:secretoglobin family 1D member 4-like n=1 Tax=Propithecus coquereli TaxID=379532 RepID=UPI00063F823D
FAPANAVVCPALASEVTGYLLAGEKAMQLQNAKFNPPPEGVAAKLEAKKCTDQMSLGKRVEIERILVISFFFMHS